MSTTFSIQFVSPIIILILCFMYLFSVAMEPDIVAEYQEKQSSRTKQLEVKEDPQNVPPPVTLSETKQVSSKDFRIVVFDLETSSGGS